MTFLLLLQAAIANAATMEEVDRLETALRMGVAATAIRPPPGGPATPLGAVEPPGDPPATANGGDATAMEEG